jgi:hypothetical protein
MRRLLPVTVAYLESLDRLDHLPAGGKGASWASSPDLEQFPRAARLSAPVRLVPLRAARRDSGRRSELERHEANRSGEDQQGRIDTAGFYTPHSPLLLFRDTVQFAFAVAGENIGAFQISGKSENMTSNVFNEVRGSEAVTDKPRKIREHCVSDGFLRQECTRDHSCLRLRRGV